MIKYFCDICKNEIQDVNYHGEFKVTTKVFAFVKHQKEDQVRTQVYLFCPDCAERVQNYLKDIPNLNGK